MSDTRTKMTAEKKLKRRQAEREERQRQEEAAAEERRQARLTKNKVIRETCVDQLTDFFGYMVDAVDSNKSLAVALFDAIDGGETFSHIVISRD